MTLLAFFADTVATGWTFENWMAFAALILSNVGIFLKQWLDARASRQRNEANVEAVKANVEAVKAVDKKVDEVKVHTNSITDKMVNAEKTISKNEGRDEERAKTEMIAAAVAVGTLAGMASEMAKVSPAVAPLKVEDGKPPLEPGNVVKADLTGSLKVK